MSAAAADLPAFVVRHLDDIARSEGFGTYTIEHKAGSKHGDGFMSNMLAITLKEATRSLSLICKLQLAISSGTDSTSVFEREVEMYRTVLPQLEALQTRYGLDGQTGFFAYPKCYLAEISANNESIIVLEDLRNTGYALWDKFVPFQFENVALLLTQLGRYHALSFVLRDQQPKVFDGLQALDDLFIAMVKNPNMGVIFTSALEQSIGLLEAEADKTLMRSLHANWLDLMKSRGNADKLKRFGVIIHGDCHTNNMMFRVSNGKPDSIVLIDWQCSTVTSPAVDLTNFLLWCTEKSLRDQHFDELLHLYHAELSRVITVCGSNADALFSYDDLLEQMRAFGTNALACAPLAVSMMITRPEEIKSLDVMDADSEDTAEKQLAPLNAATEQRFKDRLGDIITDARRLGYTAL